MDFGIFDHIDASGAPLHRQYEERLALAELYDEGGFHGYHVAEHHATPLGAAPSPSVFLASVIQRTRRMRVGPLVYTLNMHHPLRLAEEVSMLDHLSGGRLMLGVGRGISPFEISYMGGDPATAQAAYLEAYQVLMAALTQDEVSLPGRSPPVRQRADRRASAAAAAPSGLVRRRQSGVGAVVHEQPRTVALDEIAAVRASSRIMILQRRSASATAPARCLPAIASAARTSRLASEAKANTLTPARS